LARTFLATKKATSSGMVAPSASALRMRIATRISSSGGSMATVSPASKREVSRSSMSTSPLG
jgi:hypothetical protein